MDIDTIVYGAFSAITAQDCEHWIADSRIIIQHCIMLTHNNSDN